MCNCNKKLKPKWQVKNTQALRPSRPALQANRVLAKRPQGQS